MKRRYLAVLLAASTAVSQIFGTASIAQAAELIAEPEAVYTDAEEFGEIMPEDLILDAETPDEGQANQSFADLNEEAPENQPLEDLVEEGQANQSFADLNEEAPENQPLEDLVEEGQANTTPEEPTEYGQADAYDTAELSLDPTFSILSIEPETTPEGLADEAEAVPQNEDNEEAKTGPKLELAWETGTNCMTPGSSQMLHVEAWVGAEDEEGDIYRTQCDGIGFELEGVGVDSGITVEFQEGRYEFNGYTAYGMYKVTVADTAAQNEALAEDDEAGDENADTVSFTVKAYAADQNGAPLAEDEENAWTTSKTATIEVTDSYTNLEPSSIEPLLVGEKQTISAEYKKYTYQEDGSTSGVSISNIRYCWEWDPEQMEISYVPADASQESSTEEERTVLSNEEPYVIADEGVEFQLRRLTNDDITIKLYAEEWKKNESNTEEQQAAESGSGEWIEADSRKYSFGRIDYITD